MLQKISEPVSVGLVFDHTLGKVIPKKILWQKKVYLIEKIGLHHHFKVGRTLFHVFSVESKTLSFRLILNTDNLFWKLEEISDGQPD